MRLDGIHHVTAITADAPRNVDFYARLLGLRLVKKTVNFDLPDVYHLYYGDELGNPGSVVTFFEFPGAGRGRAGAGMVHRIVWRVPDAASIDFWAERLAGDGVPARRHEGGLRFSDPEGLELELVAPDGRDAALAAHAPDIPPEHAIAGLDGVRGFSMRPEDSVQLLGQTLGFEQEADGRWRVRGDTRGSLLSYDAAPAARGIQGAGTVHHVAWAAAAGEQPAWRTRVADAGAHVTPIIDREYFQSIYFREPSGVLFEIATTSPGFTRDEPAEHLGESLKLPAQHEHLRDELERSLTPLENPRARTAR